MKRGLVLIIVAALWFPMLSAGIKDIVSKAKQAAEDVKRLVDSPKTYKAGAQQGDKEFTPISAEVKNKGNSVWVAYKTGDSFYKHNGKDITKVNAGATEQFMVPITSEYQIYVWTNEPSSPNNEPKFAYTFKAEQTAYLTANPDGSMRPQTGPASGALGKTDTGLSLSKNVQTMIPAQKQTQKAQTPPPLPPKQQPVAPTSPSSSQQLPPPPAPVTGVTPPSSIPLPPPPPYKPVQPAKQTTSVDKVEETKTTPSTDRSQLLKDIERGKTLKKTDNLESPRKKATSPLEELMTAKMAERRSHVEPTSEENDEWATGAAHAG